MSINSNSVVLGLTGIIGSGKSTVAEILARHGAVILDADIFAREVVQRGTPALIEIQKQFGDTVILADGSLDRRALGEIVFKDKVQLGKLEAIVHPKIRERFLTELPKARARAEAAGTFVVYVVPLLFESKNSYPEVTKTVVVWAPVERCLERIITRDGISAELAQAKLGAQMSIEEKVRRADYVIKNDSTREALEKEVQELLRVVI